MMIFYKSKYYEILLIIFIFYYYIGLFQAFILNKGYFLNTRSKCYNHYQQCSQFVYKLDLSEIISNKEVIINNIDKYDFHLIESSDLNDIVNITIDSFYKPRFNIDTTHLTGIEKILWKYILSILNGFDKFDFYQSSYLGFYTRSYHRIQNPNFDMNGDSLIFCATFKNDTKPIATVEICLEKPCGRLAPPIKIPFKENPLKFVDDIYQPYLCNLCVLKDYRRTGLGRIVCRFVEEVVKSKWNKNQMYLHVDQGNIAAKSLYNGMNYEEILPSIPQWELKLLGMENLTYFYKQLS